MITVVCMEGFWFGAVAEVTMNIVGHYINRNVVLAGRILTDQKSDDGG